MATYAAVVSVMHLMEQIQVYHTRHFIFNDKQQMQIGSLRKKVSFLHDFLESYSYGDSNEAEGLETRIADAAYAAEDVIESYIVDDIHGRKKEMQNKTNKQKKNLARLNLVANKFSQDIQTVIECIESIIKEILVINGTSKVSVYPHLKEPEQAGSFGVLLNIEKDNVVGFDDIFNSIMEKITLKASKLQVITIDGMGGSGKSTLAKKIYDDRIVKQWFDICGWVTISQEFNLDKVLSELLIQTGKENFETHQLGEQLHKHLTGRRFFLVIDDIWSVEAWDRIKLFIQDSNNGSRILITTRLLNVANNVGSLHTFKMSLLDETQSWNLLHKKAFGQTSCPPELQEVGKVIAKNCKGLPLSIVVIGGLLRRSIKREYWEYIAENINSSINSEENERCLKILYMSYNHLPVHLKPCFLYLGIYPEDHEIRVTEVIKLWVAERFLKPNKAKNLEEVAYDYLNDLIDRNLILGSKLGPVGDMKRCKVHDLLRDLCMREATKNRFLYVIKGLKLETSQGCVSHRRLASHGSMPCKKRFPPRFHHLQSSTLRSFICDFHRLSLSTSDLKLLSILKLDNNYFPEVICELVNSRYLSFSSSCFDSPSLSSLLHLLWNLETLIIRCEYKVSLPSVIWEMSQLRHVILDGFTVDDPCAGKLAGEDYIVLENLQTFSGICDFRCSKEVLRKIPNVKKLNIVYVDTNFPSRYHKNLGRLTKLESLKCSAIEFSANFSHLTLEFSLSLKKLNLGVNDWDWEDIGERVGLLPHLEKFTLYYFFGGEEWNSLEGRFPRLKYLYLSSGSLIRWTAESTSFPCLECLHLWKMTKLEEIPSEIGDIPTLQSIQVSFCTDSTIESANMILEEQRSLGNENLLVTIVGKSSA